MSSFVAHSFRIDIWTLSFCLETQGCLLFESNIKHETTPKIFKAYIYSLINELRKSFRFLVLLDLLIYWKKSKTLDFLNIEHSKKKISVMQTFITLKFFNYFLSILQLELILLSIFTGCRKSARDVVISSMELQFWVCRLFIKFSFCVRRIFSQFIG